MRQFFLSTFIIMFWSVPFLAKGQTKRPEIITDRPDLTEGPFLVPKGGLQVELGTAVETDRRDEVRHTNFTYGTALLKYGINENFELRLASEYRGTRIKFSENESLESVGMGPLALGLKIKLAEQKGLLPQMAFQSHIHLKSGSSEFMPDYTAADFRLNFEHIIKDRFALGYNVGAEWNGHTPEANFLYTLLFSFLITEKLSSFVECYGYFPETSQADHRADAGITYKITPVIQWDISGGAGLTRNAPDSFVSTGIAFRLLR